MTTVTLFKKGTEDIFYDHMEGDIIVNYYLLCETDENGNVVDSCAFAYSACEDVYFNKNTKKLGKIKTLEEAHMFDVAEHSASVDQICSLSWLMKTNKSLGFLNKWMEFHKKEYSYMNDE